MSTAEPTAPAATVLTEPAAEPTITVTASALAKLVSDEVQKQSRAAAASTAKMSGAASARKQAIEAVIDAARAQGGQANAAFTQQDARAFLAQLDADPGMEPCGHLNGQFARRPTDASTGYPYTTCGGRTVSMNPLDECWSAPARAANRSAKLRDTI